MTTATLEDAARSLFRRIAETRVRKRRRVRFAATDTTAEPTVYFLAPDDPKPSGGARVIYRNVDILNAAGIRAAVVHSQRGFQCNWFNHSTRVTDVSSVELTQRDLLVVPEPFIDMLDDLPSGYRYVIFNQGVHLTWKFAHGNPAAHYRPGHGLAGVLTVSEHSEMFLRYAFGDLPIQRITLGIDPATFHPGDGPRRNTIAYMPRRMPADARILFEMLGARGRLDRWKPLVIENMSHAQVADALRGTKIFVGLTYQEGFGLPAAEAMACGNYVVGYHGFGGTEYYRPEFSAPIPPGDVVALARAIEHAMDQEDASPGWCSDRGRAASEFILSAYSPERERAAVETAYSRFMRPAEASRLDRPTLTSDT